MEILCSLLLNKIAALFVSSVYYYKFWHSLFFLQDLDIAPDYPTGFSKWSFAEEQKPIDGINATANFKPPQARKRLRT